MGNLCQYDDTFLVDFVDYADYISQDLTFVTGFPDYPFESMIGLFGDITGPSILD
jgi:hypothetical protein